MNIITVNNILDIVSEYFGVDKEDILHGGRTRHLARPRQISMYLAYKYTGNSTPALGRKFGKHHTTVVYACRVVGEGEEYKSILYDLDKVLVKQLQSEYSPNNKPAIAILTYSTAYSAGL